MEDFGACSDNLFIWGRNTQSKMQSGTQDCMHGKPRFKLRGFFVCLHFLCVCVNITLKKQSL